ncbi:DUF6992 family protein [Salisaeta longa]|uniref:DUF6992 family protein n=1 Tax=Salisaeta longa TaxID=503170 RepID=UPI001E44E9A9|nr:hypothetical protein [Salisaeta longa]
MAMTRSWVKRMRWCGVLLLLLLHGTSLAYAQPDVAALAAERVAAERAHLWRVGAWGALNAAGGLALVAGLRRSERPAGWGFGAQSAAWGVVNMGIAAAGVLAGDATPPPSYARALAAERTFHDILLLNMGLNVAYSAVGTTMLIAGSRGVRNAAAWRGHGTALIVQGAGLFVLDGLALWASRGRLDRLLAHSAEAMSGLSMHVAPGAVLLTYQF